MEYGEHVYFFFRETAVEYINCGKVREYARARDRYQTTQNTRPVLAAPEPPGTVKIHPAAGTVGDWPRDLAEPALLEYRNRDQPGKHRRVCTPGLGLSESGWSPRPDTPSDENRTWPADWLFCDATRSARRRINHRARMQLFFWCS